MFISHHVEDTVRTLHLISRRDLVSMLTALAMDHPEIFMEITGGNTPATDEEIAAVKATQGEDAAVRLVIATHDVKPTLARQRVNSPKIRVKP